MSVNQYVILNVKFRLNELFLNLEKLNIFLMLQYQLLEMSQKLKAIFFNMLAIIKFLA
jgi:hypothetical protein